MSDQGDPPGAKGSQAPDCQADLFLPHVNVAQIVAGGVRAHGPAAPAHVEARQRDSGLAEGGGLFDVEERIEEARQVQGRCAGFLCEIAGVGLVDEHRNVGAPRRGSAVVLGKGEGCGDPRRPQAVSADRKDVGRGRRPHGCGRGRNLSGHGRKGARLRRAHRRALSRRCRRAGRRRRPVRGRCSRFR